MKINISNHVGMKAAVFCSIFFMSIAISGCSDSNNDNENTQEPENTEVIAIETFDDLHYFQNSIVEVDEAGDIVVQHYGVVLYADDPEHLYIGVDSYEEAEGLFREWIAPDVTLGTTAPLTASLTDEEGKAQGSVTFAKGTESGHVAEVTASAETQLKKFSKITFLLNSAWPFNEADPIYNVGDVIPFPLLGFDNSYLKDDDKLLEWVCIRAQGNGQKPIFVTLTKNGYTNGLKGYFQRDKFVAIKKSRYSPGMERATLVSNIVKARWNYYCALFEDVKCGPLSQNFVWIDSWHTPNYFVSYDDYMVLSSGEIYGASNHNLFSSEDHNKALPFLFVLDWKTEDELNSQAIPTDGTNIPGITEVYDNLFDNSVDTKWYTQEPVKKDGIWFVEFYTNFETNVQKYTLYTALDTETYPLRNPVAWTLKAKRLEKDEWVILDTRDTEKNPADALPSSNGKGTTFSIKNESNKQYRYFRFEVSKSKGGFDMQLSRLALGR